MKFLGQVLRAALLALLMVGCGGRVAASPGASTSAPGASPTVDAPTATTLLVDTDVAADDIVALSFLLSAPHVTVVGITVSGTGEAHCAGGVNVVLGLLDRLGAPDIPVACGREAPLAGDHAFPAAWREGADHGSGLPLPRTNRQTAPGTAVDLIEALAGEHDGLEVLTLGPLTNLADALEFDPTLAGRLGPVFAMGGAIHVPGNIVGPGAPEGNAVAEWNVYVDPSAAQRVIDRGLRPAFVSLDGTSQVPVTPEFVRRVRANPGGEGARILADLFAANPFMTDGSYYLWDPLATELAAGYPVGSFAEASVTVELSEGPESGFTRPTTGPPNIRYLSAADAPAAEDTLLGVLNGE